MIPSHWMPECFEVDEWPDNPVSGMDLAARLLLEAPTSDCDEAWEAWDELQRSGYVWITVRGWLLTTEPIEDPEERFDGYELGQEWYKRTDYVASVKVSLQFDVRGPTVTKVIQPPESNSADSTTGAGAT